MENKILDEADIKHYQENGFVLVKKFIAPEVVDRIQDAVHEYHERFAKEKIPGTYITWEEDQDGKKLIRQLMGSQNINEDINIIAKSEKLIGAIEDLLGEQVELFHSKLMMKAAEKGSFTPWHSDWAYWRTTFKRPALMNAFLAIDSSTLENGCIRYVPGSHKQFQEHIRDPNSSGFGIGLPGGIDAYPNQPVEMEPGDIAFHDAICVHASESNRSLNSRVMNTFAYTALNNILDTEHAKNSWAFQRLKI
ncbi:MAG: phytanoyl-CoA dioxygenase family protein [Lentisphaeria bacterium]|nr:phytanoyl-CoA dioxygenase family protein [Lentisphaeria bacterium]